MKKTFRLLSLLALFSCSEGEEYADIPEPLAITWKAPKNINLEKGETKTFTPEVSNINDKTVFYWKQEGLVIAQTQALEFSKRSAGTYRLAFYAQNEHSKDSVTFSVTVSSSQPANSDAYISEVFEYLPAPGQFINTSIGNKNSGEKLIGENSGEISLGGFGGRVVAGFNHNISNREGEDFIIYGNVFRRKGKEINSEPGIVWIMQDENGNGKPDDTWYQIKGEAHSDKGVVYNYEITYTRPSTKKGDIKWTDNQNGSGSIPHNQFHDQTYFPLWLESNTLTLSGTLLPHRTTINKDGHSISRWYGKGYADNTHGGDRIDISWAADAKGNPVNLPHIRFIKIQNAVNHSTGRLGEISTEVAGIADLSLIE
ncbi:MAG: hypothetical protein MI784_10310 [Cytophagales bacterium]|nr:hypothetical protein [Cytophagales bacterium]